MATPLGEGIPLPPQVTTRTSTSQAASTSLADQLPGTVPKLDPSGLNWAIFSVRFQGPGLILMAPSPALWP